MAPFCLYIYGCSEEEGTNVHCFEHPHPPSHSTSTLRSQPVREPLSNESHAYRLFIETCIDFSRDTDWMQTTPIGQRSPTSEAQVQNTNWRSSTSVHQLAKLKYRTPSREHQLVKLKYRTLTSEHN